jgi:2',3'-cyclic-nucleotide 2'-phosphodiesterase (5'-nucleotidase family)
MRLKEDLKVAHATATGDAKVDLLLGGHDHEVVRRFDADTEADSEVIQQGCKNADIIHDGEVRDVEGKIRIIKSGTDWKGLSLIRLCVERDPAGTAFLSTVKCTYPAFAMDALLTILVKQYTDVILQQAACMTSDSAKFSQMLSSIHDRVGSLVQRPMLHTAVSLDGRNSPLRSQETNLGNMLADAVRAFYNTEIAFFNSGSVRCDSIIGPTVSSGVPILVRDIISKRQRQSPCLVTDLTHTDICPFGNSLVVKKVSGKVILQALENSVSDSHTDGRFLQISGLRITASWGRSEGNRILKATFIPRHGQPEDIKHDRLYITAIPSFIASGFDGYTWFPDQQTIIDGEAAVTDTALMLGIFGDEVSSGDPIHNRHEMGIERARRCIVVEHSDIDGLPIVAPITDGRITFIE